jgi:hypothetical protein
MTRIGTERETGTSRRELDWRVVNQKISGPAHVALNTAVATFKSA